MALIQPDGAENKNTHLNTLNTQTTEPLDISPSGDR